MILAFITGLGLGVIFFGGLHYTVQQLTKSKHPAILMILSLFLRLALVVIGLYLIRGESYWNILLALLGMLLIRTGMTLRIKRKNLVKEGERR